MFSWRSASNPCCGPKIAPRVTPSARTSRSTTWTNCWSIEAGLATMPTRLPRRRPDSSSRLDPSTVVASVVVDMAVDSVALFGKRPALGLDDPVQAEEADEPGEADVEQHGARRLQRLGAAAAADRADQERANGGGDAADVVAEARAGAAEAGREQLRQVIREGAADAEHRQPDRQVHDDT